MATSKYRNKYWGLCVPNFQSHQNNPFPTVELAKTGMSLHTYTADPIQVLRRLRVKVKYKSYVGWHDLYVVEGVGPSLLGRDWLTKVKLDWAEVRAISSMNIGKEVRGLPPSTLCLNLAPGGMKHLKHTSPSSPMPPLGFAAHRQFHMPLRNELVRN